jgi:RNA polymerase sigma factor (sigma-70 family)
MSDPGSATLVGDVPDIAVLRDARIERARAGDSAAFAELVGPQLDRLYAVAFRTLRDPETARDAVQIALLGAWRDLQQLRETDRFDAWLTRAVINACYTEARRDRRWLARLDRLPSAGVTEDTAEALADRDRLERAFRKLPPEIRAVVVMRYYASLPLTEIAATLSIPEATARTRLHRGLRQLRAAIQADERPGPGVGRFGLRRSAR